MKKHNTSIRLSDEQRDFLLKLGGGSVAKGIDEAINLLMSKEGSSELESKIDSVSEKVESLSRQFDKVIFNLK